MSINFQARYSVLCRIRLLRPKRRNGGCLMNNYLLLAACFRARNRLAPFRSTADNAAAALNGFVVHISLPALTLAYVHGLEYRPSLILPALCLANVRNRMRVLLARWQGAWFFARTTGALTLTGGLANTSFVGLPMIETFYGAEYLGLGILSTAQLMVLSTWVAE